MIHPTMVPGLSKINTTMASFKIPFLILVILITFATTHAQLDEPFYLYQYCSSNRTTANTSFQINLRTLLSYLSSNATGNTQFYNTTFTGSNPSDSIYGMFMCRGDVPSQLCEACVINATQRLSLECSLSKESVFWYDECMVWYSTNYIFSTVATNPGFPLLNTGNVSNPESFMRLLFQTMNQTAEEAANNPIGQKKFATREVLVSELQSLYCLSQCTPNLSPHDCTRCLHDIIGELPSCCNGKIGGRYLNPSCNIRYEMYPFFLSTPNAPKQVPETKISDSDLYFSEDPVYLSHNCSSNATFTSNSTFQKSLNTLFSYLSSNATNGKSFHEAQVNAQVYGLFMCRGDVPSLNCEQCVLNATRRMLSECRSFQEAIIWYSHCLLRYSHRNFFNIIEKSPVFSRLNLTRFSSTDKGQKFFIFVLSNALSKVAIQAGDSSERYGKKSLKLNNLQTLYSLAQCTQDLTSDDCKGCLGDIIGPGIAWSRLGSVGGRVMYPSCNLRFEFMPFYRDGGHQSTTPASPSEEKQSKSRLIILIIVPTSVSIMFLSVGYYLLRRKARKSFRTILKENFGHESTIVEPLQFDLAVIEAATNNFSHENFIGKGGFGEVYKGIFSSGQQIAVKRLSRGSKQGANEFKNEVLLIAKLQHRNLVAFVGFCLGEEEKMLIYKYVPNKSLDHFLFDSKRKKLLSWFERYNIIRGIAQGILYLHEHSRLKVIHRDLKPSNVLLNENMIPKISDFGLAKIVEIDQDKGNTNKIVGTIGYMSPEYAMLGQFSEKSDIFSFGVMILEIITGKKNVNSYESQYVGNSLISYVWRQWKDQAPLSILDPNIEESFSENEVTRCIQIGLLCVQQFVDARPTMTAVVSYLNNHLLNLPTPQEHAFLLQMDPKSIAQNSSSSQSMSSTLLSNNEISISEFLPR
ncbi:hypothetical protein VNO78_32705 [Psophocarpus tetragonolobus]|uniref:Cysteine-rich receptor-like protein kinase 25 n=1 Tax=Psophocarpus tetragonolobus TaxID=3891 RepID=A0AAN9RQ82_PSOTE